jgi:hypothetical protein
MPRWVWVIVAVLCMLIGCCVFMVGAGVYYFKQHVDLKTATEEDATVEFERAMKRFGDQPPIVEMSPGGRATVVNIEKRAATAGGRMPSTLHVLAFDGDENKRVKVALPFWMLRLAPDGEIKVDNPDVDLDRLKITVRDLERAGPGLVLFHRDEDTRVLVWTE